MCKSHVHNKLSAPYTGPYEVLSSAPPNYTICCKGKNKVVHGDNLKTYLRRGDLDVLELDRGGNSHPESMLLHNHDESDMPEDSDSDEEWSSAASEVGPSQEGGTAAVSGNDDPLRFLPNMTSSGRNVTRNPRYM
jgi:hypothetical protein